MPKHSNEQAPRRRRGLAAAALASVSLTSALLSACEAEPVPSQLRVTNNGPQHAEGILNCNMVFTYDQTGQVIHKQLGSPREIIYVAGRSPRIWGAVTHIVFGTIRIHEKGKDQKPSVDMTSTKTLSLWAAEDYTGPYPEGVHFAYGSGGLPDNWAENIHFPYVPDKKGHLMATAGDPFLARSQAELRQPPYADRANYDQTRYDTVNIHCEDSQPVGQPSLIYIPDQYTYGPKSGPSIVAQKSN